MFNLFLLSKRMKNPLRVRKLLALGNVSNGYTSVRFTFTEQPPFSYSNLVSSSCNSVG